MNTPLIGAPKTERIRSSKHLQMRPGFAFALVAAFGVGGLSMPAAAHAAEPTTKTVTWTVTTGSFADRFGTPQTLFGGNTAACGVGPFQQDVYRYDTDEHRAVVDALIAKGTLASSSEDSTVWISNVDLPATAACVPVTPPVTPSPTPTSTPSSPPPTAAPSPTPTPVTSSTPTPAPSSAPSPTTVPTPSSTPAAATVNGSGQTQQKTATAPESLAYTGSDNRGLRFLAFGLVTAGVMLVAGRALVLRKRKARS